MTWQLFFTEQYNKRAAKFSKLHHDVETQYAKTLELLKLNPHHPSLRLYGLPEKLDGLQSIAINLKYRIVLEMIITEIEIVLINVGDHDAVYCF